MPEKNKINQEILTMLPESKIKGQKKLFWEELYYEHQIDPFLTSTWPAEFMNLCLHHRVLFASAWTMNGFRILWSPAANNHGGFGRRASTEIMDSWYANPILINIGTNADFKEGK